MKIIQETPTIEIKIIEEIGDLDILKEGDYISLTGLMGDSIPGIFCEREGNTFYVLEMAIIGKLHEEIKERPVKVKHEFRRGIKYPVLANEDFIPLNESSEEYGKLINLLEEIFPGDQE